MTENIIIIDDSGRTEQLSPGAGYRTDPNYFLKLNLMQMGQY